MGKKIGLVAATLAMLGAFVGFALIADDAAADDTRFSLEGYMGFGKNDSLVTKTFLAPGDSARSGWIVVNRCRTLTLYAWFTGDTATWRLDHSDDGTHFREVATGLMNDSADSTNIDLWEELEHGTANALDAWDLSMVRFVLTCTDTADTLNDIVAGLKCREE